MSEISSSTSEEISLKELIVILIKEKWLILSTVLIALIVAINVSNYLSNTSQKAEVVVGFDFQGIDMHQNPDGSTFDPYQVATPYILGSVISSMDLKGVTPNDLRKLIELRPIEPDDVMTIKTHKLEQDGEIFVHYPNEYILSVKTNPSIGIDEQVASLIAYEVIKTYTSHFQSSFIRRDPVRNLLSIFESDNYDFSDISAIYRSQVEELRLYNKTMTSVDQTYRSIRTGMSFSDLNTIVGMIEEIDINRVDAMISNYKLTKDEQKLLIYYDYILKELQFQRDNLGDAAAVNKDMLSSIEDTSTSSLSTLVGDDSYDAQGYFNQLVNEAFQAETGALAIQEQISFYENEVEELTTGNYILDYDRNSVVEEVTTLLNRIEEDLLYWIDMTDTTVTEYYENNYADMIIELSPVVVSDDVNGMLNVAIGLVLGGMIGVFIAFGKAYWQHDQNVGEIIYEA